MPPAPSNPSAPAPLSAEIDLRVSLGRLALRNPILTASGTFGYAREMEKLVDFSQLGGILPKTVTTAPRIGNKPWRTVETSAGLLNSIGLDNDGIDAFIEHHLPYLATLPTAIIVSIAGANHDEFVEMAKQLDGLPGVAAIELAHAAGRPVLAVGQHDDAGLRRRALAAGAGRVFAYRRLFEDGPRQLATWLAEDRDAESPA